MGTKKQRNNKMARTNPSHRVQYPAKYKRVAGRWILKGVRGKLSGRAKELNIVGLK